MSEKYHKLKSDDWIDQDCDTCEYAGTDACLFCPNEMEEDEEW